MPKHCLSHYLALLEDARKFSQMDAFSKSQMLNELGVIIKNDALWTLHCAKDSLKQRIKIALSQRLFGDILDFITSEIANRDFAVLCAKTHAPNSPYPKELKIAFRAGVLEYSSAFLKAKDYELNDIYATCFVIFSKNSSFDLRNFASNLAKKYSNSFFAFAKNGGHFILCAKERELKTKISVNELIDFNKKCALNENALKELCGFWVFNARFSHAKTGFYERLVSAILGANRVLLGSATCYTMRQVWSDKYDKNSYFN